MMDAPNEPNEPTPDDSMRAGMEELIAAMKNRRPAPAVGIGADSTLLPSTGDDGEVLAGAPWDAVEADQDVLERGALVGRYVVLQQLGVGGMGVVYAAYDPELDRKLAIKLLLPGVGGASGRTRLLREAQTLARLGHPNVVAIHDVGTMGEQVWLAMELVQGHTLRDWLAVPRGWQDVVAVMSRAGEGLAAAHAAELLHRDFKPDNVMVSSDGRVRVMDFGLARVQPNASLVPEDESVSPKLDALAMEVTRAGAVLGTPGYMAAEQFDGAELTAAADQFAFCVTLWEALHGERPFAGGTWMELAANVLGGRLRPPPKGRHTPAWLRRACERGLAVAPAQRWPSMHALLDVLAKGRTRARARKGLAALGVLALLGAGVEGQRRYILAQRTAACEASGAEIETAWSPARELALRDALVATGVSYAATTADAAVPWLDRQAEQWREARVEACLAADVYGTWDTETLDRSLWCLDARHMELGTLVDELTLADASVVQRVVPAAAGLSQIAACRNAAVLETLTPPPLEARDAIRSAWVLVIRASSIERAGRYDQGIELAREALTQAAELQWPPLTAAARLRLGSLLARKGPYADAELVLEEAYFAATGGVAPEVAASAAIRLVSLVGNRLARPTDGLRWGRLATAALVYVNDGESLLRASLVSNLANLRTLAGAYEEAMTLHEQALALREAVLGPDHPDVADVFTGLTAVYMKTGVYDQARRGAERALTIREQTLGPDHPEVANAVGNLAVVLQTSAAYGEALTLHERALAMKERVSGPSHPDVADSLNNIAVLHAMTGAYDEARPLYARALAIREQAFGRDDPRVAQTLGNFAGVLRATGALDEAKLLRERALAIQERKLGPEHPALGHSLVGLAEIALEQQRWADAVALGERATTVREKGRVPVHELAEARFALARALWEAAEDGGRDRARAVPLAVQARDGFRTAGKVAATRLEEVEAWLAEPGGRG